MTLDYKLGRWFDGHVTKEAAKDRLRLSERGGQLIGVVINLIVAVYFTALYTSGSNFFTSNFTSAEAALFFGTAYFGIIPSLLKLIIGSKNSIRPLDVVLSILILIVVVLFLTAFPFDFTHLPDALPSSLQFLLSWISDGLVKLLMVFGIVVSFVMIPYTTLLFLGVRRKLSRPAGEMNSK